MQRLKRLRLGRGAVAVAAGVLLIVGLAAPASATSRPFEGTVVGGGLTLSATSGTNSFGGTPACSNGTDDEYPDEQPHTAENNKDGAIDYPADPQCATPFDNSERINGFQPAVGISVRGTIDDATGAFNIPASGVTFPDATLYLTTPLPGFVVNTTKADSALTGTIDPGTGAVSFTSSDFTFHAQICLQAGLTCNGTNPTPGAGSPNPPPPYGSGDTWSADCNIDVHPTNMNSSDANGAPYFPAAGVFTAADSDFSIPVPTDAGTVGVTQALPCSALAGGFGFPTTGGTANHSEIAFQFSTLKAVGQAKSITVGNGTVVEPGPNGSKPGTAKITFPVTVNTAPATDLTFTIQTIGSAILGPGFATEQTKPVNPNADFNSMDNKIGTIKAGKTAGKIAVSVLSDSAVEANELFVVAIGGVSDPTYTVVKGQGLGTIQDRPADNLLSVTGSDVAEGSNAGASATKPAFEQAVFTLTLSKAQLTDTTIAYCTQSVTAVETDLTKPLTPAKIGDFGPVPCSAPKLKVIKATKLTSAIAIKVNQDTTAEPDEAFALVIANVSGSSATLNPATPFGISRILADD
jgi:hypothetical protein